MIKVLTIDWSYFFTTPFEVRQELFPKTTPYTKPDNSKWLEVPLTRDITVDWESLGTLYEVLSSNLPRIRKSFISENQADMYQIANEIQREYPNEELVITNVDFYHDFYHEDSEVNRENWFRRVCDKHPATIAKWCRRLNSPTVTPEGDVFKVNHLLETFIPIISRKISQGAFKYVHLCRSDLYSPPVIDTLFSTFMDFLQMNSDDFEKRDVLQNRVEIAYKFKGGVYSE